MYSERPHRYCHLANIYRTPHISYTLQWAGICPSNYLGDLASVQKVTRDADQHGAAVVNLADN